MVEAHHDNGVIVAFVGIVPNTRVRAEHARDRKRENNREGGGRREEGGGRREEREEG